MEPDELVQLLDIVNPDREVGKVVLITRYGADLVRLLLMPFCLLWPSRPLFAFSHKILLFFHILAHNS